MAFTNQWWAVWTEQVGPPDEFAPMQLFQGKTIGAGDCIDPINRQRISFNRGNDESPSLVLKPASAGASGADLVWSRNDGVQGLSGHIWLASADCTARWRSRQLSFAGQVDLEADMFRYANVNHVTWMRDEELIVYANNASGTYRSRTFLTRGAQPRVAASMGNRFVVWQDHLGHPFGAVYRNGRWVGPGPDANRHQPAAGGRGDRRPRVGHPPGRKPREQPPSRHRQHLTPARPTATLAGFRRRRHPGAPRARPGRAQPGRGLPARDRPPAPRSADRRVADQSTVVSVLRACYESRYGD